MADKEFESEDPMELVGTVMELDDDGLEEMGLTFVEELARMNWSREQIEAVFTDPFYRGPHTVFRVRGPAFVAWLIDSVMGDAVSAAQNLEPVSRYNQTHTCAGNDDVPTTPKRG